MHARSETSEENDSNQVQQFPFVLTSPAHHGLRIVAANQLAIQMGITTGIRFTDATARVPHLQSAPLNKDADRRALQKLALWFQRYSPAIMMTASDELMLDVTGCLHLFGGEECLLANMKKRLVTTGFSSRIALAGTQGAAHAFAHYHPASELSPFIVSSDNTQDELSPLPIASLRLEENTQQLLRRFGLNTQGHLFSLNRASLEQRFHSAEQSEDVLKRLDQVLGRRSEPFVPLQAVPEFFARLPCVEPLIHRDGIQEGLRRLLGTLSADLGQAGKGAYRFVFRTYRVDNTAQDITVSSARPTRDPNHIMRLFEEKLDGINPGFGIELLTLDALRLEKFGDRVQGFTRILQDEGRDEEAVSALADRLSARLGEDRVQVLVPHQSYIPERSEELKSYTGISLPWGEATWFRGGARPLRMLEPPEPVRVMSEVPDGPPKRFVWRHLTRNVCKSEGPERIGREWWLNGAKHHRTRDYYRVEDREGLRYWLFREGLYDDPFDGRSPDWYVHGLFS